MAKNKTKTRPFSKFKFSKDILIVFVVVFAAIGGYLLYHSFAAGGGFTANIFVAATGGSTSCTRSATLIDYATASSSNHVCGPGGSTADTVGWEEACEAAADGNISSGTIIGVKAGNYPGGNLGDSEDCSGGLGAAVNPNAVEQGVTTGTTAAWAKYECADGTATKNVVVGLGDGGSEWIHNASHVLVTGGCFDLHSIDIGAGGDDSSQRTTEIQIVGGPGCATDPTSSDCINVDGIEVQGAKDILFKNINHGPFLICAKNTAAVPAAYRCNSNVAFEAPFTNLGTGLSTCGQNPDNAPNDCGGYFTPDPRVQDYFHEAAFPSQNLRMENVYEHDDQGVFSGVHTGCWQDSGDPESPQQGPSNWVFDHFVCERVQTAGMQMASDGVTIENSVFTCTTNPLDGSGGAWDQCLNGFYSPGIGCKGTCVLHDFLFRYNTLVAGNGGTPTLLLINPGSGAAFVNARIIGNIFGVTPSGCNLSGVTCDHNAFLNGVGTAGTNATMLAAGNPFVQPSTATPGHSYSQYSILNLNLTGTPAVPTIADTGSGTGDYNLGHDAAGNPRSNPTHYGAYEFGGTAGGGTTPIPGDVNGDGHVNATDLSILLSDWNTNTSSCDFNTDGTVNIFDLSTLLAHYGT